MTTATTKLQRLDSDKRYHLDLYVKQCQESQGWVHPEIQKAIEFYYDMQMELERQNPLGTDIRPNAHACHCVVALVNKTFVNKGRA